MTAMRSVLASVALSTVVWGGGSSAWAGAGESPRPTTSAGSDSSSRAKIAFGETKFDFGRIGMGAVIRHDFVFTNTGTATLEIRDVRPGCGCMTAGEWTRTVAPGGTGVVAVALDTSGLLKEISQGTVVHCNDPDRPTVRLDIQGTVWRAFEVKPAFAGFVLALESQTNETKVVQIVSQLEEAVTLFEPRSTNAGFRAELRTVQPGKEFELAISTVPPLAPGYTRNAFAIETSSAEAPRVMVTAQATVRKAVHLMPERIALPAGPLPAARTNRVSVRGNGLEPLALSEARIDLPGVAVRIEEVQAGRLFWVAMEFPAGFQLEPGHRGELTFRSNHAKYPLLQVPVVVFPPAAGPVALPAGPLSASTNRPPDPAGASRRGSEP